MSNVFEKAVDVLHENGHTKGELSDDNGAVCAMGALREADNSDFHCHSQRAMNVAVRHLIHKEGFRPVDGTNTILHPLAQWNDKPERSAEDVILLFKTLGADADAVAEVER